MNYKPPFGLLFSVYKKKRTYSFLGHTMISSHHMFLCGNTYSSSLKMPQLSFPSLTYRAHQHVCGYQKGKQEGIFNPKFHHRNVMDVYSAAK